MKSLKQVISNTTSQFIAPGRCTSAPASKLLVLSLGLFAVALVQAQTTPDAGALRQQFDRGQPSQLLPQASPEVAPLPSEIDVKASITVTVKAFQFAGNTLLSQEHLSVVVAPWVGRALDLKGLREAATAVATAYRKAGAVVSTYLPKQDITNGQITIQIVEALYGGARIEGEASTRIDPARVLAFVNDSQTPGALIDAPALNRAVLLVNDLPGIAVSGVLIAGQHERETESVLKITDKPLLTGALTLDNQGSRSTGPSRAVLQAALDSPFKIGDQLRLDYADAPGSNYGQIGYTLPIGSRGWRAGINASKMNYHFVTSEFQALDGSGLSESLGGSLSYPIIRSRQANLNVSVEYSGKRFHNKALRVTQSDYHIDDWTVTFSGNRFDSYAGGGANSAKLSYTLGRVELGQINAAESAANQGSFVKLNYALSRQQAITSKLSLYLSYSGQVADRALDTSERFYLGGPYGVRAYPVNEGAGNNGQLASAELRWRLSSQFLLAPFYDWGHVGNTTVASHSLKGYGLALAWSPESSIKIQATWAHRHGSNPNPSAAGNDQDGSLNKNRFWLQATKSF